MGNSGTKKKKKDKESKVSAIITSSTISNGKDDKKKTSINISSSNASSKKVAVKGPSIGKPVKFGNDNNDNDNDDAEGDLDSDASFLDMLKGPRIVLPKPCSICGTAMKVTRYRDWDTHVDYCQSCAEDTKAPYSGNLIGADDVDSLYPAHGRLVRATLLDAFNRFARRPCLAVHQRFLPPGASCDFPRCKSPYRWFSYQTIFDQAMNLAAAMIPLVKAGTFVGICGPNRIDWVVTDLACLFAGLVSVPLHVTLTDDETAAIIAQSEPSLVVCQANLLGRFTASRCGAYVKNIIVFDEMAQAVNVTDMMHDIPVHAMSVIQSRGRDVRASSPDGKLVLPASVSSDPEAMITILYTSGNTPYIH